MWDVTTGQPSQVVQGHGVAGVTNSQNVSCLATVGSAVAGPAGAAGAAAENAGDGGGGGGGNERLVSGSWDKTARVWCQQEGQVLDNDAQSPAQVLQHEVAVNAVASVNGLVATGSGDGGLRLFDPATGALNKVLCER